MSKSIQIPYKESYEKHYSDLSTASHEIMNYAATIGSTYQYIHNKYPEAHDFKFWDNLGISINQLCSFMKQSSVCRYCHFPQKNNTTVSKIIDTVYENLDDYPHQDIINYIHISSENAPASLFGDTDHIASAIYQLIINAYEAQTDSIEPDIQVVIKENGDSVCISVTNPGVIDDTYSYEQLADAFFSTKPNHAGCGLYIANIVCSTHDGCLTIGCSNDSTVITMNLAAEGK